MTRGKRGAFTLSASHAPPLCKSMDEFHSGRVMHYCAKSLLGEALCGSAVYGIWTEMSPAPLPPARPLLPPCQTPLPPPDPPSPKTA